VDSIKELGMGIESPTKGRQNGSVRKWRRCNHRFFAASLPFFFFSLHYHGASLAGDETNGRKNPRVPKMRRPANLERWNIKNAQWKSSAVLLQQLRQTVHSALKIHLPPFFFSTEASD
jgi:hypothetical protein